MRTERFEGGLLSALLIAALAITSMAFGISTTSVNAPSTISASPGATLSPTSAMANTGIEFTVTVTNDYVADNIDNVLLKAPGFTQPTDLKPTTWDLSESTDYVRFDAIGDNVITPGGSETFVFLWTTPNITTQKDYMISVLVSKEEWIYTTYENLGGFMVTIDGKKPTLIINVTQVGVTPVNVVGTALDNAKATITITASETLLSLDNVYVENSGGTGENFLPPITMTTTDNLVYTGTFTVENWDDNAVVVRVSKFKDAAGNENTNVENSLTVDTRAPVFIENGLSTLVSSMRINVVQAGTGTVFCYVDDSASENMVIIVQDNAVGEADNDYWVTSVTIDTTAATRDPTFESRWTQSITLSEGLNSIVKVTATDRAGNTMSDNVENIFIDTQPPTIEFNTVAGETWDENGELINDNTPEIKITVLDPGYPISGLGVARIAANNDNLRVAIDNDDNVLNGSSYSFENLENKAEWNPSTGVFENLIDNAGKGLAKGTYWINVVASDNLAHVGTFTVRASRSFTIEKQKPLTPRAPIYIEGNAGFTPENGVNGGGSGTENDPYIIENWDISAENANGIEIRSTTAYFIIRNSYVHDGLRIFNGGRTGHYGIRFNHVSNGKIDNTTLDNNYKGITMSWSNNIISNCIIKGNSTGISLSNISNNNLIENCIIENNFTGIRLKESNNNTLNNNTSSGNDDYGIYLRFNSDNNTLTNNICENNVIGIHLEESDKNLVENNTAGNNGSGIDLVYSDNNLVENNTAGNNYYGIDLVYSDNNLVENNTVGNNVIGIYLWHSYNNFVTNNLAENNSGHGIYLTWYSDNNLIYHNEIMNNTNQAYDDGTNTWDNGYPSGGNYWSDYTGVDADGDGIGDTPYNILWGANQDRYPLMNPWPVPHLGTAVFSLVNLYTVNVEKILDLYAGSKLVVKFYTYGDAFENENVIENFSPPWHVEDNEEARHPEGIGVKKARLVLTTDNTENVISTIASFTVRRVTLELRYMGIPLEWALASPVEKVALEIEFSQIPLYWALAPS